MNVRSFRLSVMLLVLLSGCEPSAHRLLLLDLALTDPVLLNGTAQPWRDEGYTVEYRRFYPHLARSDLQRYRVILCLLGRDPEAPSDALTAGVRRGRGGISGSLDGKPLARIRGSGDFHR